PVIGLAFAGAVLAFNNYYNGHRANKTKTKDQTQIMTVTTVTMGVLKMASSRNRF
ncbi:PTS system mannose-specific transporter subunit IIC, partial [Lacticaseibacillus rhamnosus MTCC 5462]